MISFLKGDLFESQAVAWVNPVNTVGTMGAGVALEFKNRFPQMYREYRAACKRHEYEIGVVQWFDNRPTNKPPYYIINFPTKEHWRGASRYEWIAEGLANLVELTEVEPIISVAVPALGCGYGGLEWHIVKALMQEAFAESHGVHWYIYEPATVLLR